MRLIILAAGEGTRLRPLTDEQPKCLVPLGGRPLLDWQLAAAASVGVDEVVVVGGHCIGALAGYPVTLVENVCYAETNMVESLLVAWDWLEKGAVVAYGDIAYRPAVLSRVASTAGDVVVGIDLAWLPYWRQRFEDPLVDAESLRLRGDGTISSIGRPIATVAEVEAQYVGLLKFTSAGAAAFRRTYEALVDQHPDGRRLYMTSVLDRLAQAEPVVGAPFEGGWVEVDSLSDLALADRLVAQGRLGRGAT